MTDRMIRTKHGEISLEELAEIQPGMARLMDEVARRWHYTYYAAKGGNWDLARHELEQVMTILNIAGKLRPKYTEDLSEFISQKLASVSQSIEKHDWEGFNESVQRAIDASNAYHEKYGYGFIRYVLPRTPPDHLELSPPSKRTPERS